jgi:hypothetical protein
MLPFTVAATENFETLYGQLLQTYWRPAVTIHGIRTTVFDYAGMNRDAGASDALLNRTLAALERTDPAQFTDPNAAKAFWINVYNIGAMRMVVDHYPIDSIRSFKISLLRYPWSKDAVVIQGKAYSLKEIEKDILLARYNDPRVVFAVSCAAVSCPDRIAEPFTSARIDAQLDTMIRAFFADTTKGFALDTAHGVATLSWILDKDGHLFSATESGVLNFIRPYLSEEQQRWLTDRDVQIRYFEHDWALNDLALADR